MFFNRLSMVWILFVPNALSWAQELEMTRVVFASNLFLVKEGDSKERITKRLGPPSKVLRPNAMDPYEIPLVVRRTKATEVWYYGTNDTSDFPTLGQLYFDESGKIITMYGGEGTPINSKSIGEDKLREFLRLVNSMPEASGSKWDPLVVVNIANALVEIGKEDGLSVIQEFIRG